MDCSPHLWRDDGSGFFQAFVDDERVPYHPRAVQDPIDGAEARANALQKILNLRRIGKVCSKICRIRAPFPQVLYIGLVKRFSGSPAKRHLRLETAGKTIGEDFSQTARAAGDEVNAAFSDKRDNGALAVFGRKRLHEALYPAFPGAIAYRRLVDAATPQLVKEQGGDLIVFETVVRDFDVAPEKTAVLAPRRLPESGERAVKRERLGAAAFPNMKECDARPDVSRHQRLDEKKGPAQRGVEAPSNRSFLALVSRQFHIDGKCMDDDAGEAAFFLQFVQQAEVVSFYCGVELEDAGLAPEEGVSGQCKRHSPVEGTVCPGFQCVEDSPVHSQRKERGPPGLTRCHGLGFACVVFPACGGFLPNRRKIKELRVGRVFFRSFVSPRWNRGRGRCVGQTAQISREVADALIFKKKGGIEGAAKIFLHAAHNIKEPHRIEAKRVETCFNG